MAGIKFHVGVSRGQSRVKLIRNALWQPNVANAGLERMMLTGALVYTTKISKSVCKYVCTYIQTYIQT